MTESVSKQRIKLFGYDCVNIFVLKIDENTNIPNRCNIIYMNMTSQIFVNGRSAKSMKIKFKQT